MNTTEHPIVAVRALGTPEKDGRSFVARTEYEFDDGRTFTSTTRRERKKDVLPAIDRADEHAKAGELTGRLREDGTFLGTTTSYYIGPKVTR